MNEWVWSNGGMILIGENWSAGRKTLITVNHPDILWGVALLIFSSFCRAPHGQLSWYFSGVWTVNFVWPVTDFFSPYFFPNTSRYFFRAFERWILSTFCLASNRHFSLYFFFGASLFIFRAFERWILSGLKQTFCSIIFFRASPDIYIFFGRLALNMLDILSGRPFCTYWPCDRIRIQKKFTSHSEHC